MKKVLFLSVVIVYSLVTFSQVRFGIKAGGGISSKYGNLNFLEAPSNATISMNIQDDLLGSIDYSYFGGVNLEIPLSKTIFIQPEMLFIEKNIATYQELEYTENNITNYEYNSLNAYSRFIEVPIPVDFNLSDHFSIYVGPSVSYLISSQYQYHYYTEQNNSAGRLISHNTVDDEITDGTGLNKLGMSVLTGLSFKFHSGFNFGIRAICGLNKVFKEQTEYKLITFNGVLGFTFGKNRR